MERYRALVWARRHPDLWVALGLALVAFGLLAPYMARPDAMIWPRSELGTDFLSYRWAHVHHLRQSLQRFGEVPLWRGTTLGGEPMIGNPSVMLFYPPQFLLALLPLPIFPSFAFQTAVHLWIAGMGSYALLRQGMRLGRPAALVGALATMLAPRLSSNAAGDVGLTYAMCWVPFSLAWTRLALDRRRWSWAILAGMGLAFQFLLHVHIFFCTLWVAGLYALYRMRSEYVSLLRAQGRDQARRACLAQGDMLAVVALVCGGLAAFELLPFITYMPYLSRQTMSLSEANNFALPPQVLASAFMPSPSKFPEWELYVGLLPAALAPLALLHPRRAEAWFWIGLAAFAVLFSLGTVTPLFPFLFHYVPGFRWLRVPARMWYYGALALVVLAGLAVDALLQPETRSRWQRGWQNWLLLSGWALALVTITGRWLTRRAGEPDWLLGWAGSLGLLLGLSGVGLWMRGRIQRARWLEGALVGALLLDLLPVDAAYMSARPAGPLFHMPSIGDGLLQETAQAQPPFRIYAARGELPYHLATNEGLEVIDGLNSFQFEPYVELVKQASGCLLPGFAASVPPCSTNEVSATAYQHAIPDPHLLGLLNVKYVLTPIELAGDEWVLRDAVDGEYLYENLAVLPRAFGVGRVEAVPDRAAVWPRLAEIDVRQAAVIEAGQLAQPLPQVPFHVPATILSYEPNEVRVQVEMPGDGVLMVGTNWTPGWRARDDGEPARVLRVNGAVQGVYLPKGSHQVTLRFRPPALAWGAIISGFTLLACVLALVLERRKAHVDESAKIRYDDKDMYTQ